MRKYLAVLTILVLLLGVSAQGVLAQPTDTKGHWAEAQINEWVNNGLAAGYPDGSFKPSVEITRAQFIALVNNAFEFNNITERNFNDVNSTDWFANEVAKASYITGYEDGSFRPNNRISRQEAAVVIAKILELSPSENDSGKFLDAGSIPNWSKGAVGAVVSKGFMTGYPDKTFGAQKSISRAEAVSSLDRAMKGRLAEEAREVIYNQAGTYGPAVGTETIDNNVVISVQDVILQNLVIKGDLLLAEEIGEGDVTLKNVTVLGNTVIKGGGANSVVLENCTMPTITVSKEGVRVVASGNTTVNIVTLESGATLVQLTVTGEGFESITLSEVIPAEAKVSLQGDFPQVTVDAKVEVEIVQGTVDKVILNQAATISGEGKITQADINASGASINQKPTTVTVAPSVSASVGGSSVSNNTSQSQTTTSGGSSGGGGGGSNAVAVTSITVTGAGSATTISTQGGTLQMSAAVGPANASNKAVTWTVANDTGSATISSTGLLTAVTNGTVTVRATANDGSGVNGQLIITISGQAAAFTPGAGGSIPSFTSFTAEANKIGGLYVGKNHCYYSIIFGGNPIYDHNVELWFPTPASIGATGYQLQYSADNGGNWSDYTGVSTTSATQDNFIVRDPLGNYSYRLMVIGGAKAGYVSNAVAADIPAVNSEFTGWSLDESFTISGVMFPFVGRGLEASFTAQVADYENPEPIYTDEHMTFQWYRVNPLTYEMTPIPGATGLTYITTEADLGYKLLIRATGDEEEIGGYAQIFSNGTTVMPNDAYITNVSADGFTLNLYKSVGGLGQSDLELTDYNGDPVVITAVTPGDSAGIYNIAASLNLADGPFTLHNKSDFWKITSQMPGGHGQHEGVQVPFNEIFTDLEVIDISAENFYACVYDTDNNNEPILGLIKADFTLKDDLDNVVDFNFNDPALRDPSIPASEYLLSPVTGVFAAGDYTLTFAKVGYKTATETFTITVR